MTSMQALEDAEERRNSAQSDLVAAKARVVSARQQLQRTLVRAPFDGIVSDRKVSGGDTAQVGKELLKVIDPSSMRFEGLVSADRMQDVKVGQEVHFRINGFPQRDFAGKVKRVDATANEMTRQVSVLVSFADPANAPHVAGLYAEGRVSMPAGTHQALALPEGSIVRSGNAPVVWQIRSDGKLHKTVVQLGARDPRTGEYPLVAGLSEGDRILRAPSDSLTDGQAVEYSGGHAGAASTPAAR
jgi:RND family efflux transporter MFP subunit